MQHNPRIADGIDGFEAFVATLLQDFPDLRAEVKRIFAEGEYVVAHVYGVRGRASRERRSSTSSGSTRTGRSSSTGM